MNPDCAASASSSLLATAPMGGGRSTNILYHHHSDLRHHVHTNISHCDTVEVSAHNRPDCLSMLLSNDSPIVRLRESGAMKNEKLTATTVRFTDSDLHHIDRLQEKLGLGMIHIIRLAIRRLAEAENLLPLPSTPKKR